MGSTRIKHGDHRILFHVGKELPAESESIMLVPGVQGAQGRGMYCAEKPDLRYKGGEHYQKELEIAPVFLIPMEGDWRKGALKKRDETIYNTEGRAVALRNLKYAEVQLEHGGKVRYYFSTDISFFSEPKRKVYDEVFGAIRSGRLGFHEAETLLRQEANEERADPEEVRKHIEQAMEEARMPKVESIAEELRREREMEHTQETHLGFR